MSYKDPEQIRQYKQRYYLANKERIKAKSKQYRLDNLDARRAYSQAYRQRYGRRSNQSAMQKRLRQDRRLLLNNIKSRTPCADCRQIYPPYVMDFDHVTGDKLFNVGAMVSKLNSSNKRILEEIAKCEIVCANCHRQRTHNRGYTYPGPV